MALQKRNVHLIKVSADIYVFINDLKRHIHTMALKVLSSQKDAARQSEWSQLEFVWANENGMNWGML